MTGRPIRTLSSKTAPRVAGGKVDYWIMAVGDQVLLSLFGYNAGGQQWIQLHDASALPADTTVPLHTFAIGAADNYSVIVPLTGIGFSTGIVVVVSTSGPTLTAGAKDVTMLATLAS